MWLLQGVGKRIMWDRSIGIDLLVETMVNEFEQNSLLQTEEGFLNSIQKLKERFPSCSEKEIIEIIQLALSMYSYKQEEKTELVITAPNSFKVVARKTRTVVEEMINNAERSITLTGYSISDYFADMLDIIIHKSTTGVYVTLYINNVEKHKEKIKRVIAYSGKFIKIYNYNKQNEDNMAALHAKLIVVDRKMSFISSANLSYHGMQGNIEMGVLIESKKKATEVEELLTTMRTLKVFERIR